MIIGGNTSYYNDAAPIWMQPAPTLPFGFGSGSSTIGSGGAFFTGSAAQAPFNPYYGQANFNPYDFVSYNPFVAPNTQANQVVYAHYAPGQAVQGQVYGATNPVATSTTPAATTPETPKPEQPKPAAPKPAETKPAEEKKPEPRKVTVKSGDSLSKIAAANGTTWQKLYELNKGVVGGDPNLIRPGQVLKMP